MKTGTYTGKIQLMFRVGRCLILNSLFVMMFISCTGQYKGMPREEVLAYHTYSTYGELYALAQAYAESINAAVKADTLHPGMYADYGVVLAQMGHREAACRMLNAEMLAFPESRGQVMRVKQSLLPELMGNEQADRTADTAQLARWAYDSISALRPLTAVASVIDSSDREWISQQTPTDSVEIPIRLTANQKREMLLQEQTEAERLRKAREDSVAAAKQAKLDARKQVKADKEKAKKQKVKAKKQADKEKKRLDKQRQKERKQQAAEKEAQRKQQTAEKEAQRKQQAAEKEAQRKQQAAEKEAQRKQQTAEKEAQRKQQAAEKEAQRKQNVKGGGK